VPQRDPKRGPKGAQRRQGQGQHPEQGRERASIQIRAGKGIARGAVQGKGQHAEQGRERERDNIQSRARRGT